jgi:aminotransferase EvaB
MTIPIPINDLKRHSDSISDELECAIERVISRGWYILGPEVEAFESEFAATCGVGHCVGVANGTDALELALRALDIGPGDQIATVANAGMYSTTAIKIVGAEPAYVDINPVSMTMDAAALAAALTSRVRAVIVTHLYGQMADMPKLLEAADQIGASVVEDCAQAHGAVLDGRPAGSWGDIGCFSFYPTKNLGALGDGGAIVTADETLAKQVRLLRQYGWTSKYRPSLPGGRNSRLDELQAAILRAKLPYLEEWNERRREIARIYTDAFQPLDLVAPTNFGRDYVAHLYVVRTSHRDRLKTELAEREIRTDTHYPIPDYQQPSIRGSGSALWSLPTTEQCCREVLTLPCFPEMTDAEIERVVDAVCDALA